MAVVWIDAVNAEVKRVRSLVLDPHILDWSREYSFDSEGVESGPEGVSKAIGEKFIWFLKQVNPSGQLDARPQLVVWDQFQLTLLTKTNEKVFDNIRKEVVFLQDQYYNLLKYEPKLQNLSLEEICEYAAIDGEPRDQFCRLALWMERNNREIAKRIKAKTQKKDDA